MEDYKFCILAGGVGSRIGGFTKHFNKAMLPIQGKPVINHIIGKVPEEVEVVISIGYLGEGLREYVTTTYPNRNLSFVEDDMSTEHGRGPGYGLLRCKNSLQCPFILSAVDTLVLEEIPEPRENWFGLARVLNIERFCSARISNERVIRLDDKIKTDNEFAFIGLTGIKDYDVFWNALESNQNTINGEIQVSNGLTSLLERDLHAKIFTWFDVGTRESYSHAIKNYPFGNSYKGE
ncbi:MAG: NTP transferase domain-containing protein [Nanoarchaeota archaeon]